MWIFSTMVVADIIQWHQDIVANTLFASIFLTSSSSLNINGITTPASSPPRQMGPMYFDYRTQVVPDYGRKTEGDDCHSMNRVIESHPYILILFCLPPLAVVFTYRPTYGKQLGVPGTAVLTCWSKQLDFTEDRINNKHNIVYSNRRSLLKVIRVIHEPIVTPYARDQM